MRLKKRHNLDYIYNQGNYLHPHLLLISLMQYLFAVKVDTAAKWIANLFAVKVDTAAKWIAIVTRHAYSDYSKIFPLYLYIDQLTFNTFTAAFSRSWRNRIRTGWSCTSHSSTIYLYNKINICIMNTNTNWLLGHLGQQRPYSGADGSGLAQLSLGHVIKRQ